MALILRLETSSTIPIEVESIRPDLLSGQTADDIAGICVQQGNVKVPLAELFDVSGSLTEDSTIEWHGECSTVRGIGLGMTSGTIRIAGNAGMHTGAGMRGGRILCEGSTGDWLGCEMQGGSIVVDGSAGNCVGGTYRGGQRGMTGGEILIRGNAGHEIGRNMRRGIIAIGGSCGDGAGFGMIAGTIVLNGIVGRHTGAGMKRGTIVCLGTETEFELLPTFRYSGRISPEFFRVLRKQMQPHCSFLSESPVDVTFDRYVGDAIEQGQGEIVLRRKSADSASCGLEILSVSHA